MKKSLLLTAMLVLASLADVSGQDVKPAVPIFPQPSGGKTEDKKDEKKTEDKKDEKKTDKGGFKDGTVIPTAPPAKETITPKVVLPTEGDEDLLPLTFIKNRIETMPVGTKAYVAVESIRCDSARKCWLDPDALYGTLAEGRVVLVEKTTDFTITIDKNSPTQQWVAQELPEDVKWVPVKSIKAK